MPVRLKSSAEWMPWLYSLAIIPLVLLVIETMRGGIRETQMVAEEIRHAELQQLRWRALEQAATLNVLRDLARRTPGEELTWIDRSEVLGFWSGIQPDGPEYLYSAVVDRDGDILLHTDPRQAGKRLERGWYDRRLPRYGDDLTWSEQSPLANNGEAYDVSIELRGDGAGENLHAGLDAAWLDDKVAARQRSILGRWAGVLGLVGLADLAAGWALVSIWRHHRRLQRALGSTARQRARELAQIGSGLAHEIRNPLHALRINLHTLRRAVGGKSLLPPDELVATINESDAAIDRLDVLMRDLLMFADPKQGDVAQVDLVHEVRATLRLLSEDLKREHIAVHEALPAEPAEISIDATRLRQSLLNLLTFAQHRSGRSGTIEVEVARDGNGIELSVGDSGPSMAADQQEHIFEPFQAAADTGSGLGLALVQTYVEEVGGRVSFNGDGGAKSRCRVWFPLAESANGGTL